jgi:F-type H+-transporting ATPase subunit delta
MEELVAKRYIKAMLKGSDIESMKNIATIFSTLANSFKDEKFINVIENPSVSMSDKSTILLDSVKSIDSAEVNNLIKILVENKRINIIPAIAEEMRKNVARTAKKYEGIIYSDSYIDEKIVSELGSGLSKKFDSDITLTFVKNNYDGIKVDVEDLGIEIDFSQARINSQMIEHIIKAI